MNTPPAPQAAPHAYHGRVRSDLLACKSSYMDVSPQAALDMYSAARLHRALHEEPHPAEPHRLYELEDEDTRWQRRPLQAEVASPAIPAGGRARTLQAQTTNHKRRRCSDLYACAAAPSRRPQPRHSIPRR